MNRNINLIAFGTFGNPYGFRQTFFIGDSESPKKIKSFDLNTVAIKLFPKSRLYSIRKETFNNKNIIAYSIYDFANEPNSTRGGTFIGSSILFINQIAEENITINCLNDFHNNLKNKNVQNDTIIVNHSDKFSVSKPKNIDEINFHLREINNLNFVQNSNKQLVVYCETNPHKLQTLFKKAIDLLNVYDTIYFTESKEVAEFVHQKNIFQLVQKDGFETEIQKLAEERLQKIQNSIDEFTREKQKLEEDKKRLIDEYRSQIEQNERQHQENQRRIEEAKNEQNNITQRYEVYSRKIDEAIRRLQSGEKLDNVRQLHNENKRNFIDSINRQQKPNFLNSITNPNARTNLRIEQPTTQPKQRDYHNERLIEVQARKIGLFKVIIVVLLFLWAATFVYFLFFDKPEKEETNIYEPKKKVSKTFEPTPNQELSPKPNDELNEADYKTVADEIRPNTAVNEIVEIIFSKNPTDIKKHYDQQKDSYAKLLFQKNKGCFKESKGTMYFVKDTLKHIPSYRGNK